MGRGLCPVAALALGCCIFVSSTSTALASPRTELARTLHAYPPSLGNLPQALGHAEPLTASDGPEHSPLRPAVNATTTRTWSGYSVCEAPGTAGNCGFPAGNSSLYGARSNFTVPEVRATAGPTTEAIQVWTGIGGSVSPSGGGSLVAAGVRAAPSNSVSSSVSYEAFWEMQLNSASVVSLAPDGVISVGDAMRVSVAFAGLDNNRDQLWNISIEDTSTGSSWNKTLPCAVGCIPSDFAYAAWVVEAAPVLGSGDPPSLPDTSDVEFFSSAYLRQGSWSLLSASDPGLDSLTMENSRLPAVPSPVYSKGTFWVQYALEPVDPWHSGLDLASSGSLRPGDAVEGFLVTDSRVYFWNASAPWVFFTLTLTGSGRSACSIPDGPVAPVTVFPYLHSYVVSGPLCRDIPSGAYNVSIDLWLAEANPITNRSGAMLLFATGPLTSGSVVVSIAIPPPWAVLSSPWLEIIVGALAVGAIILSTFVGLQRRRRAREQAGSRP